MSPESASLRVLARRIVAAHDGLPGFAAALLTGSAALGISDRYSDIDLILYYTALPIEDDLARAQATLTNDSPLWSVGDPQSGALMRALPLDGVECQVVHTTWEALDAQFRSVQETLDVASPTQKLLSGMLDGLVLRGEETIAPWIARAAAYPDALATRMIEAHLSFFPLWATDGWRDARDCALWQAEMRYEAAKNLLAVLSGLNRVYFTPFQLKHTQRLCTKFALAPPELAARLESLLAGDLVALRTLVDEAITLVETHRPDISTQTVRRQLARQWRPWVRAAS